MRRYLRSMSVIVVLVVMGGLGPMWGRLESKIESRVGSVETRLGRLEARLTDNLMALNRDIGERTGASHTHTSG